VILQDELLIRPGVPVLDLLNGAAAGNTGGQPQNEVEAQLGFTQKGMGVRLSADWKSATTVRGGLGSTTGDLNFSDITKVNLRLFADLGAQRNLVQKHPWLRGSRITLSANNLFDQRVEVRDANGLIPASYQPAYLDPAGRTVKLSFRKLFF
jgi:outer membrane receptor protein involved in Fe transport